MSKKNKQKQHQQSKPKIATKEIETDDLSLDFEFAEMHEALSLDWKVSTLRQLGEMPQERFDEMTDDKQFDDAEVAILTRRRRVWRTENAEAPKTEQPAGDSKGDEQPAGDSKGDDQPAGDSKGDEQPAGDSKGDEQPAGDSKGDDQPAGDSKGDEQPAGDSKGDEQPAGDSKGDEQPAGDEDEDEDEAVTLYDDEASLMAAKPTDPADRRKPFRVVFNGGEKFVWSWATGPAIVAVARWLGCSAKKIGPRKRPPAKTQAQKLADKIAKMSPEEREQLKSLFATSEPSTPTG